MKKNTNKKDTELKVLVLEDSHEDLELMREHLLNEGYRLDLTHVENEAGFTASLRDNSFDLILSDFNLPDIDGFGALKICRELCPDTPFICISGTIGEDTAVELLKQGAVDYVLKDKPGKLPLAVRRALEEAKAKADYQKAEEALKKSEEKFRSLAENTSDIILIMDLRGKITYISRMLEEKMGYKEEEVKGANIKKLLTPESYNVAMDRIQKRLKGEGVNAPYEVGIVNKSGNVIPFELNTSAITKNGEIKGIQIVARDITERKKAEEALRKSEEMMRNSQSVAHICSYSTDLNVDEIEKSSWVCSPEFYKIFGIDESYQHTIKGWAGFIHPDCREEVFAYHESVVKEKTAFNREYKIIRINDGAERWVHGTGELEFDENGKPVRMHGAIQDITERKQVEKVLLESEDRFKKLSSFTFEGIIIHNNAIAIDINNSALELLGCERDEIIGMNLFGIIHPDYHAMVKANLVKQVATSYQVVVIRKNGSTFDAEIEAKNISYNDEYFRVACIRDITERKKMLKELVAAKEKAEESSRLKTAFLNNISHEIRTPLNGILGFGELISGMDLSREETEEMVRHVRQSSKRLTDTVSNYMDMARIVSGTMEVHKKEFPLPPLLEDAIGKQKPLCEEKKIGLKSVIPEQCVGISLFSDRDLILKTIIILLDNSLKFTGQGEIICGCRLIPEYLEFYVQDTGIGIADDKLELIFDIFSQEDISDTRVNEGSGLGLSIASGLTDLLGGSLSVTSEKGKGSTFTFTVPYKAAELTEKVPPAEKKTDSAAGKPLVLLAEDEESNYLYLEVILKKAGYEYLLAKNGEEAVAYCKQHPEITLVLMDIKMPVMNGEEATRHIREFRPDLPIIATTAYAQTGDKQRFLAAGFDEYLPKPIKSASLLATIKNYSSLKS
mgnify:CR=1 FL=1